jgi:hypothetical protein
VHLDAADLAGVLQAHELPLQICHVKIFITKKR